MKKEEILAQCLEEIQSGRTTIEDCLARYPRFQEEIRLLLNIVTSIRQDETAPTEAFKVRTRNRLYAEMEAEAHKSDKVTPKEWWRWIPARLASFSVVATFIIISVAASGGTVYASRSSLPGDILYPVKTSLENIQLVITFDRKDKANLHLRLAQQRIYEAAKQSELNRNIGAYALATAAGRIDSALNEINTVLPVEPAKTEAFLSELSQFSLEQQLLLHRLIATAPPANEPLLRKALEVTRRSNVIAKVGYENPAFLNSQPSVRDEDLDRGQFEIQGTLLNSDGQTWNVGGVILTNIVTRKELPAIGSQIKIEGLAKGKKTYVTKLEVKNRAGGTVKIDGTFTGADEERKTWYMGNLPIGAPENGVPPSKGDNLKVRGIIQDGNLIVTQVETKKESEKGAKLDGVLVQVNNNSGTITTSLAGTQVTVNISEANIETEGGKVLSSSELSPLVGRDVEVEGLQQKDSTLYASKVTVETEHDDDEDKDNDKDDDDKEDNEEGKRSSSEKKRDND